MPMDARGRVRQFLARGTADRAPFLVMATEYTARLAQCGPAELLADPGLFVRSYSESVAVLGLEAVLIEVPAARVLPVAAGGDPASCGLAVMRENLHRLRATLRDQIAIVAVLPGPLTLAGSLGVAATSAVAATPASSATLDEMDDLVAALIRVQEYLGPAELDALALLERAGVADPDVPALADAAAAFWNVARYYSLPSLLIAAEGTARLADAGATAVAAWAGVTASELLAAGATAAGQPPPAPANVTGPPPPADAAAGQPPPAEPSVTGRPPSSAPAPLPPGGFYLSPGEIPAGWPVDAVRAMVRQLSQG
jgi:hypothetical protein